MKLKWLFPFGILVAIGILGLFNNPISEASKTESLPSVPGDVAWMITASGLVLLMTPGLSFFYGGMVRMKNVISTMLQSFISLGVISILWVFIGFSLAFGDSIGGFIGNPFTYFMFKNVGLNTDPILSPTIPLALFALFQLKFAIITPALITGSFAERIRFSGYLLFICLFAIVIYSPLAHWTWHPDGFLRKMGVLDFAGGTVVHMSAGLAALAGAMVLGQRRDHSKKIMHKPANIPFVILGTGMLWFGWFGFNGGSALAANETAVQAFLTTNTASAAAMLTWIFIDSIKGLKVSALGACIGSVVGLVAITPAAGFVTVGQSIFIGIAASALSNYMVHLKAKTQVDDTLDVFPCHGIGGMFGMVVTGIFAANVGLVYGDTTTFLNHLLALLIVTVFAFTGSYLLFKITDMIIPIRVTENQEIIGLDISQHGESTYYPEEFKLTEISSK